MYNWLKYKNAALQVLILDSFLPHIRLLYNLLAYPRNPAPSLEIVILRLHLVNNDAPTNGNLDFLFSSLIALDK